MYILSVRIITMVLVLCMDSAVSAPRKSRLTLAEPMPGYYHTDIGGDSGAYSFGYDVWDPATGNTQFRNEERYPNGTVVGSYGYKDALGEFRTFKYVADERGYRVKNEGKSTTDQSSNANLVATSTEPTITWTRPSKKKPHQNKGNVFQKRKYNDVQQPGYYLLY